MATRQQEKEARKTARADREREAADAANEPQILTVGVTASRGGKVAIRSYGNITSEWFVSLSRSYAVPADWTEDQAIEFQLAKEAELSEIADKRDQEEYDSRYEQSYLRFED